MTSLDYINSTVYNNFSISNKAPNELFEGYSDELLNFAAVACIIFIIVGVPGNLLTIVALSRGKQTRRSTAVFIINLSLSDLLFGCFNLPLAVSTFMQRSWRHGDLLCRFFPLLRYGLCAVSLFTVSLITLNRYIIIAHPRKYPRIYQRRFLALMVACSWLLAFFVMIPTWQGIWGRFGLDIEIGSCSILPDDNGHSPKEFLFVIAFIFPCICIVFCYARIWYLVRTAASRTRTESPPVKNTSNRLNDELTPPHENKIIKEDCVPKEIVPLTQPTQEMLHRPFFVNLDDIEYIDVSDSNDDGMPISYSYAEKKPKIPKITDTLKIENQNQPNVDRHESFNYINDNKTQLQSNQNNNNNNMNNAKPLITTSMTRFHPRKVNYVSIGNNTSNASSIYPGRMSIKDRRLLKMILVIFVWFLVCYLPITITKVWKEANEMHFLNISGYLLIYLTTCINPIIYVLMSSEYRRAYWRLLSCRPDPQSYNGPNNKLEAKRKIKR